MDVPSVPASVTAVIASGKLPPEFAAFFTAAGELTDGTDWSDVASAVDEYLADGGVDETSELWWYSEDMRSLAGESRAENAEMDVYVAKHGAPPRRRLESKLRQANDLYSAGDRAVGGSLKRGPGHSRCPSP